MSNTTAQKLVNEGDALIKRAESIFSFFSDREELYQSASNKYKSAAISYRTFDGVDNLDKSGEMFLLSAKVLPKTSINGHDAVELYTNAEKCFRFCNPNRSIGILIRLCEIAVDKGDQRKLIKYYTDIASIYKQIHDKDNAYKYYELAKNLLIIDDNHNAADKMLMEMIKLNMSRNLFLSYAEGFELFGKKSKISCSYDNYFFSLLFYIGTGDYVLTKIKLDEFKSMTAYGIRQFEFIEEIVECIESSDIDRFEDVCAKYDNITHLVAWQVDLLSTIKVYIDVDVDLS